MEKYATALKDEIIRITWWMRGGITYTEAMQLGFKERELIGKLIKDNQEASKKAGIPIF